MVQRAERLFEVSGTVSANFQKTRREPYLLCTPDSIQPLPNRFRHGVGHALAGDLRKLAGKSMSFFVLYV